MSALAGWVVGFHLATAHLGPSVGVQNPGWATPGVYVVSPEGWTAGALRNSHGRFGAYLGYTKRQDDFSVSFALATGYETAPVVPILTMGYTLGETRVLFVLHPTAPINIAIERRFK